MRRTLLVIVVGLCVGWGLWGVKPAEAQTYNLVWILDASTSPNPFQAGVESTTLTIETFEFAQWFWLFPSTMVRPTVVVQVADRWFIANMTSEWYSQIGFWGWWFYWWYVQDGMWTHQVIWDGRDLAGHLVPPGPYLATITVYAGGASTFGSVLINVESPLSVSITSPPEGANIALGADTTFTADASPSQYTSQIAWSGGETPPTGTGGSFTTQFATGGLKTVTASVTAGTQSASDSVQVNVLRLDYLLVTPAKTAVPVGRTAAFTAQGYNNGANGIPEQGGGDDIPLYVTPNWSTTGGIGTVNPSTQSPTTMFQAVATLPEGKTKLKGTIRATAGTVVGEAEVEVYVPRLDTVIINPAEKTIRVGSSITFTTTVKDQEGTTWDYGDLSYQWYLDDTPLPGETNSSLTYSFPTKGTHMVKVSVSYLDQMKEGKAKVTVVDLQVENVSPDLGGIPETLEEETPFDVTISGYFESPLSAVSFGQGIDVNSFTLVSDTTIIANITIKSAAASGLRDISVTIGDRTVVGKNLFTVVSVLIQSCFSQCVVGTRETILFADGTRTTQVSATVTAGGKPVVNREVNFEIVSGGGDLTPGSALTDANGQATVTLTAGTETAKTVVKATVANSGTKRTTVYMYRQQIQTGVAFDFNTIIPDLDLTTSDPNRDTQQEIEDWLLAIGSGLANLKYNGRLITQIIYDATQDYSVSAETILTTLQKEQSLVTTPTPTEFQLNNAMGCGPASNIEKQIDCGAKTLEKWYDNAPAMPYLFPIFNNPQANIYYVDATDGSRAVRFQVTNSATYSLYRYTPWIRTSVGGGGNHLFFRVWKQFGF